jgi:4-amino-4-deoxy-L-arabinose transferase-like glycosyltransferase
VSTDAATSGAAKEPPTLTEALLGQELLAMPLLAKVRAWPTELRTTLVTLILAGAVLLPFLGAVGLWDPWEVHYGEVAREMVQRNDYVHPFWENAWFFSKPAFTMWMQALGLQAAEGGTALALVLGLLLSGLGFALYTGRAGKPSPYKEFNGALLLLLGVFALVLFAWGKTVNLPWTFAGVAGGDGALPVFTEWGIRLPFTGFSMIALGLLTYAMTIAVNARAALATAFVLVTMPLYFLLSRQAVTDTPIVAATISGIACAMVGLYDKHTRYRSQWWYGSYVFFAIATLAKGLLGFGIPMVVFILYAAVVVIPWTARATGTHLAWFVRHLVPAMATGLVAGLVAGATAYWLGEQWATTFMAVPVIDNVSLLSAPAWLGIMWGSLFFWAGTTVQLGLNARRVNEKPPALFALAYDMRLGTGILLFLAVALPWYYEMFTFWRLDDESKIFWFRFIIHDHFARLGSGVHTTTPGGDFTYFILQGGYAMFPWVALVPGALATLARAKPRSGQGWDGVAVIATLWFVFTFVLIGDSATKFHHYVFPMLPRSRSRWVCSSTSCGKKASKRTR